MQGRGRQDGGDRAQHQHGHLESRIAQDRERDGEPLARAKGAARQGHRQLQAHAAGSRRSQEILGQGKFKT